MTNKFTTTEEIYQGNQFFEPVIKRGKFWAYEFKGDLEMMLLFPNGFLAGLNEKGQLVFNGKKISLLDISRLNFKGRTVKFTDITFFDNELEVKNAKFYFSNCTFQGALKLNNCRDARLDVVKCKGLKDVNVFMCNATYFNIANSIVDKVSISGGIDSIIRIFNTGDVNIAIEVCKLKSIILSDMTLVNFFAYDTEIGIIDLSNLTCSKNLEFRTQAKTDYGFKFQNLNISKCNFPKFELKNEYLNLELYPVNINIINTKNIFIFNHHLENLRIEGEYMESIKVFDCKINNLEFNGFSCKENIKFQKSSIYIGDNKLTITDSVLKGIEINPSFLHDFSTIDFKDSTITGIELHNYKPIHPDVFRNSKMEIECKIDLCRELNALMLSQNNSHYSTVYKAIELELRAKSNDSSLSWFDKQVLNLNYWSNVHGTMPQKAFLWILVLIVLMFGIINLDLAIQTNLPYEAGFDFLSQNYSYFIKPFTFLSDIEVTYKPFHSENMQARFYPVTKGFDFLFKVFYAYLLYQFVAAFRKFNK